MEVTILYGFRDRNMELNPSFIQQIIILSIYVVHCAIWVLPPQKVYFLLVWLNSF